MINQRWNKKSICHFDYKLRGKGPRKSKWAIRHKTHYGLFLIKLRNK